MTELEQGPEFEWLENWDTEEEPSSEWRGVWGSVRSIMEKAGLPKELWILLMILISQEPLG